MTLTAEPAALSYLVPLDGRIGPPWVADHAIRLATLSGGQVLGLCTLPGEAAQPVFAGFVQRCQAAQVRCETVHVPGGRIHSVMNEVTQADVVMVAWAPHLRPFDFSPLNALIRHTTRPIWLTQETDEVPSLLTVAFHGQRKAFHAIRQTARLAHEWQCPVDILVVAEGRDINDHDVLIARQELRAAGVIERRSRFERGSPGAVLAGATSPAQVLVMGGAGDGLVFGLLLSSVVHRVLKRPQGPVLLCP